MKRRINSIKNDLQGYKNNLDLYRLLNLEEDIITDTYEEIEEVLELADSIKSIEVVDGNVYLECKGVGRIGIKNKHIQDIILSSADTDYDEFYKIVDIERIRNSLAENVSKIDNLYFLSKDAKYMAFDKTKKSVIFIYGDKDKEQREIVNRTVYRMCSMLKNNTGVLVEIKNTKDEL